jgi:hypothetical protein
MTTPLMRQHLGVLALFCLLTAVMVHPLVLHPASLTAGWEGDNTFCIRQFWWVKRALVDLRISPFVDPGTYYPEGHEIANGELFPATTIPAIPITMLWGPVVAYNLTLLFTFVMTGFGTYIWIRRLTGSAAAGIVAGIVAAFLPYRFAHLPGHLHMVSTHWMPWVLYAFERFLERKRLSRAVVLGACVAMVALSSWYYAYAVALMLPVYAIVRSRPWREHWNLDWWRGMAAAGAMAAVMVVPLIWPYLQLRARGGLTRELAEMESWSLNFYAFFIPNRLNPAWRSWVEYWFPQEDGQWVERGVALGFTALALALVAFVARRRHRAIYALVAVWVVSFLIALGPTLRFGDRQVIVPVPRPVVAAVLRAQALVPERARMGPALRTQLLTEQVMAVPMPAMFLYAYVPMTSGMRVMTRFGIWTGLMTAGLAGWGAWLLIQALQRRFGYEQIVSVAVVAVIGSLVLAESRSGIETLPLRPRAMDLWLAEQPPRSLVELPMDQSQRPLQDYYKTVHGQPTAFGPIGDGFYPPIYEQRKNALADFPSPASVAALREWKVGYLLFTPSQILDWPRLQQRVAATPGLTFDREMDGVVLYRLD